MFDLRKRLAVVWCLLVLAPPELTAFPRFYWHVMARPLVMPQWRSHMWRGSGHGGISYLREAGSMRRGVPAAACLRAQEVAVGTVRGSER